MNSHFSFSSTPHFLWHAYLKYLWNPHPTSWVSKVAYSFRLLAFLLILPVVILTLLDITSYVIARTLGIVDDLKASTSDKTVVTDAGTSILVQDTSADESPPVEQERHTRNVRVQDEMKAFFAGEEEDLQLSGVGVFSPSPSQPSSPVLPYDKLSGEGRVMKVEDAYDDIRNLRQRPGKQ